MPVRFIYFDAGFTLIRPWPSVGFWYGLIAAGYGVDVASEKLDKGFYAAWKIVRRRYEPLTPVPYGCTEAESIRFWSDVVEETFAQAGRRAPASPAFHDDVFHRFARGECWRMYEDAEEALRLLESKGIRWGVLSNWDARLRPVLRDLGLADRAAALVLSCEVGAEKPARQVFTAAEKAAGCAAEEMALIGDEPGVDGRGPLEAGWRQCLVYRDSAAPPAAFNGLAWAPDLARAVERVLGREGLPGDR